MNLLPHEADRVSRRAFFSLFPLSIFLLITGFALPGTAQAQLYVRVPEGTSSRATLTLRNRCAEPHTFRVTLKEPAGYIRFEEPAEAILIAGTSKKELGMIFNAATLERQVYRGTVQSECVDCGGKCTIDKVVVPYEMTVTESPEITQLAAKYRAQLNDEFTKSGAIVEEDARKKLNAILKEGASELTKSGAKGRVRESYKNLKILAAALIKNAVKRKISSPGTGFGAYPPDDEELVITEKSVGAAMEAICPLFPFCK
jgi:hypothetical protein